MKIDLRGNIKSAGSVFLTYAKGVQGRALLRRTVAVEDDAPWRRGQGWGILIVPGVVLTVGSWRPDTDPNMAEVREAMEMAHEIPGWRTLFEITTATNPLPGGWTIVPLNETEQREGEACERS